MKNLTSEIQLVIARWGVSLTIGVVASLGFAEEYDNPPINYQTAQPTDAVAKLVQRLASGESRLEWNEPHGWLVALLDELDVPRSSQTLVFSKTSQQHRRISPARPRALYFNDDVYVGWVQQGDFVELAAVDDNLGAVFYAADQTDSNQLKIRRDNGQCLTCHASNKTQKVPGFLVRSVFPKRSGHPDFSLGTLPTDHSTHLRDRFGGWYVTGHHGKMRHRGNVIVGVDARAPLDREAGANLQKVPRRVRSERYVEPTSDIVALMLLEHQTQMHNFVTAASYETRRALYYQASMNRALEREADYQSDSTRRRIQSAVDDLVEYLFFVDEFEFTSPVRGNSSFSEVFQRAGIRDSKGRSLRDLDLQTGLLKYPCSFLVYSKSFAALPDEAMRLVRQKMLSVLQGEETSRQFSHLTAEDRGAILEILVETHPLFREASLSATDQSAIIQHVKD